MSRTARRRTHNDYSVAIVCAMSLELDAAKYMLSNHHDRLPREAGDTNLYALGDIHGHNVVLACLSGQQGKGAAATVSTNLSRTFPSIELRLFVGIGGGVPSTTNDIRLGDVVVSMPRDRSGGVVQYDLGRHKDSGFELKGFLNPPPPILRQAAEHMKSDHRVKANQIEKYINDMCQKYPDSEMSEYTCPQHPDILFSWDYEHPSDHTSCDDCDLQRKIERKERLKAVPKIHYGLIASGDAVIKSARRRDELCQELGTVLCFEMEAAGMLGERDCMVIRGISDYANSHKNDAWHHYAAATAAACAMEMLSYIDAPRSARRGRSPSMIEDRSQIRDRERDGRAEEQNEHVRDKNGKENRDGRDGGFYGKGVYQSGSGSMTWSGDLNIS